MDGRRTPAAASSDGQLDASAQIWFQFVCMGLLSLNDCINVELIPPMHVDAGTIVVVVYHTYYIMYVGLPLLAAKPQTHGRELRA